MEGSIFHRSEPTCMTRKTSFSVGRMQGQRKRDLGPSDGSSMCTGGAGLEHFLHVGHSIDW